MEVIQQSSIKSHCYSSYKTPKWKIVVLAWFRHHQGQCSINFINNFRLTSVLYSLPKSKWSFSSFNKRILIFVIFERWKWWVKGFEKLQIQLRTLKSTKILGTYIVLSCILFIFLCYMTHLDRLYLSHHPVSNVM